MDTLLNSRDTGYFHRPSSRRRGTRRSSPRTGLGSLNRRAEESCGCRPGSARSRDEGAYLHLRLLREREQEIEDNLEDLTDAWTESIQNLEWNLRQGNTLESQVGGLVQDLEARILDGLKRRQRIGEALQEALENTNSPRFG